MVCFSHLCVLAPTHMLSHLTFGVTRAVGTSDHNACTVDRALHELTKKLIDFWQIQDVFDLLFLKGLSQDILWSIKVSLKVCIHLFFLS